MDNQEGEDDVKIKRSVAVVAFLLDIVLALTILVFFKPNAWVVVLLAIMTVLAFFSIYGPSIVLKILASELSDASIMIILSKDISHFFNDSFSGCNAPWSKKIP